METTIEDLDAMHELMQLYIDGANGDTEKLARAFHPDAWMMGHIGPRETHVPIGDFVAAIADDPGRAGPGYRAVIRSIDLTGDAGVVVLVETDFGGLDFVNYFTVARRDGRWEITNKTYAHTAGEPAPPEVEEARAAGRER